METCGFKEIERERYNEHKIVVVYGVVVGGAQYRQHTVATT